MINAAWHWQCITRLNPISPSPGASIHRTNINVKIAFYTQTAPLIPLRELLAVYSNVSPSIFCNFPQTLVPPPGLSQVNNNQSMFRVRFRIFSVPCRAEMSVRNRSPPRSQWLHTPNHRPGICPIRHFRQICPICVIVPPPTRTLPQNWASLSPQTKPQLTNTLRLVWRGRWRAMLDVRMSVL